MENNLYLFYGGFLSQWHYSNFVIDGVWFSTCEQYMMYKKSLMFHDYETCTKIMATDDPSEQKAYGRMVKNFNKALWEKHARKIIYDGNYAKFTQNPKLLKELIATGNKEFCEASPTDIIWGCGLSASDVRIWDKKNWRGKNWLGEILTQVKNDLLKEKC